MNDLSEHPTEQRLRAFSEGRLSDTDLADVERHLETCSTCLGQLERAPDTDPLLSRLRLAAHRPAAVLAPDDTLPTGRAPLPSPPGYELLGELGRGGMGVVYKARQVSLGRLVALKMLLGGHRASPEEQVRFRAEASALARLRHPNIVQVYDTGTHDGVPYLALEYVDGGSLAKKVDHRPLRPRDAAGLVEALARAMHLAHSRNVVHRDLKPANVLLAADGTPKVTDFGLAKQLDLAPGHTRSGAVVGTPSYMAPEQASGDTRQVGPAADVYALGAILYELLTGRPPFQAATALATLVQVRSQDPVPPGRLRPGLPRDLETVCLKCLSKEPEKRYASADGLADDLRRWQAGEPIQARPAGRLERFAKWARRDPVVAALLALVALAVAGGGGGIYLKYLDAEEQTALAREMAQEAGDKAGEAERERERETAAGLAEQRRVALLELKKQKEQAEEERDRANYVAYAFRLREAQAELARGRPDRARAVLATCDPKLFGWEHAYLLRQASMLQFEFRPHNKFFRRAAFSPDGKRLATSCEGEPAVKFWDLRTGLEVGSLKGAGGGVAGMSFSPDGERLLLQGVNKAMKVWDLAANKEVLSLDVGADAVAAAFSPDGRRIAVVNWRGEWRGVAPTLSEARVWDARTGEELLRLKAPPEDVTCVAFSPDGKRLAAGGGRYGQEPRLPFQPGEVKVWDARSGRETLAIKKASLSAVHSVAFSPDGKRIVTGGARAHKPGEVKVWDADTGHEVLSLAGHLNGVNAAAFSPDGTHLASADMDGTIKIWDAQTGQERLSLEAHQGAVYRVGFVADGKRIFSWGNDARVRVWDTRPRPAALSLQGHGKCVCSVAVSPDGERVAAGGPTVWRPEGEVKVWDAQAAREVLSFTGHRGEVTGVAFSPDGKHIASGTRFGGKGELKVWDARTGRTAMTIAGHEGDVRGLAFSPDGKRVASIGDRTAKVWDVQTGKEALTLRWRTGLPYCVAFSPDGKRLLTGGQKADGSGEVTLWDARTGQELLSLRGHTRFVVWVAYSRDGKRVVAGGADHTVRVWDAATGREMLCLKGHTDVVTGVAFSPDGKRIASGGADRVVKVWESQTGQELLTLPGHVGPIFSLAFFPDGTRLVSGGGRWHEPGELKVWDARAP